MQRKICPSQWTWQRCHFWGEKVLLCYCHREDTKDTPKIAGLNISVEKTNNHSRTHCIFKIHNPNSPTVHQLHYTIQKQTPKYRLNGTAAVNRPRIEQRVLTKKLQGEKWFQVTLSTWPLNRQSRWLSCGLLQSYSTADLWEKGIGNEKRSGQNTLWGLFYQ